MKKSTKIILIVVGILIVLFLAYFIYMQYFNGEITDQGWLSDSFQNQVKCIWEPGLCKKLCVGPLYYYNSSSQKCELWESGGCCTNPPFETLEECESSCLNKIFCDANHPCKYKIQECLKLPEDEAFICRGFMEANEYQCPNGTIKIISKTYPREVICE